MNNDRQIQVLQSFKGDYDLVLKKSQIKALGNIRYYANTDKHLGDVLTRMVNNNSLKRVSFGKYQLSRFPGLKHEPQPKNQLKLL